MKVNIELFYSLKKYCKDRLKGNENSFTLNLEGRDEITLNELIVLLGIPQDEVGFATRNKVKFDWNEPIRNDDSVKLYPVIIAG